MECLLFPSSTTVTGDKPAETHPPRTLCSCHLVRCTHASGKVHETESGPSVRIHKTFRQAVFHLWHPSCLEAGQQGRGGGQIFAFGSKQKHSLTLGPHSLLRAATEIPLRKKQSQPVPKEGQKQALPPSSPSLQKLGEGCHEGDWHQSLSKKKAQVLLGAQQVLFRLALFPLNSFPLGKTGSTLSLWSGWAAGVLPSTGMTNCSVVTA